MNKLRLLAIVAAIGTVPTFLAGLAHAESVGTDPYFARQWALQKIQARGAWASTTGTGVLVAVVDTGVDFGHPDLDGKLVYFPDADFVEPGGTCTGGGKKGRTCTQDGAQDANGHGTHVAGIAAAETDNGLGVAGVAPGAQILPVRVLDENGEGTTDQVAAGIRYAADKGADVINLSLGFLSGVGEVANLVGLLDPVHDAIAYAREREAVVVVAAGNDSVPLCAEPAAADGVLCVGATDANDLRAWYSNADATMLKNYLVAPGGVGSLFCEDDGDIWSTILPGSDLDCTGTATVGGGQFAPAYETLAGTSMAAPHVSGVAALLSAKGLAAPEVVTCILGSADDLGPPGRDPVFGYGRVNAARAAQGTGAIEACGN